MPPAQFSSVELLSTPQDKGLDALAADIAALLGGGIVNPFGPTLQLIAVAGPWRVGADLPIIQSTLNPFLQEIQQIGVLKLRELFSPDETLAAVLPHSPGGCPTALLVSPLMRKRPVEMVSSIAAYLAACDHGGMTLESVKKFPGDPRARVKHDVDQSMKIIVAQRKGEDVSPPIDRKLATEEAVELTQIQLHRGHWLAEWRGFVTCWGESIEHQQQSGIARLALPFTAIETLFNSVVDASYATLAATFPEWDTQRPT